MSIYFVGANCLGGFITLAKVRFFWTIIAIDISLMAVPNVLV